MPDDDKKLWYVDPNLSLGALRAASEQQRASLVEVAENLGAFYERLCVYMDDGDAFELTSILLGESLTSDGER